jgi:glycosyltransferase involved in cell wall biosynthesis
MTLPLSRENLTVAMISRNEEGAIAKVMADIRRATPEAEILLVDSSVDKTAEIAASLGARVIRQIPPRGYNAAMDLALRSASGRVVVTMDCDDTYPADRIPEMARLVLDEGYDLVDASRLQGRPASMPLINYLANYGFALGASAVFGQRLTDLHSGMRAYRKSMIDDLKFDIAGTALPVELLLLPIQRGYRYKVIFIDYRERVGQSKMRPLYSAWWTLRRIVTVRTKG